MHDVYVYTECKLTSTGYKYSPCMLTCLHSKIKKATHTHKKRGVWVKTEDANDHARAYIHITATTTTQSVHWCLKNKKEDI